MTEVNLLDELLSAAEKELDTIPIPRLTETNIFDKESNLCTNSDRDDQVKEKPSLVHGGDTDSSDDEDNKYPEQRKYDQYGKEIKHLLQSSEKVTSWPVASAPKPITTVNCSASTDPVFGLRIINPLVSFTTLQDRMTGREAVSFMNIKSFVAGNISDKNWVIAGVIVGKSAVKTSQNGSHFLIWTLSDLKHDMKTVSVFLFGNAYKQLWKTATSTVVGLLNPSVFEKNNMSKDQAHLSIDNAHKVLIMGQSKDLGTCKSVKKNGEKCTAIVNVNTCEFCVYHVKQEYQKCSRRSELQSNFTGKGLVALRNKVLGKNEVFYAGKSYTAVPAKRSQKLEDRDRGRLHTLNGDGQNSNTAPRKGVKRKQAANLDVSHHQRTRDLALLEKLTGNEVRTTFRACHSTEVSLESAKNAARGMITKLQNATEESTANVNKCQQRAPRVIDLNTTATPQQVSRAKLNALKYIREKGPLKKSDPNTTKPPPKRPNQEPDGDGPNKIPKFPDMKERFHKMMSVSSKHLDLLEAVDRTEQDKYFHRLEMKERMEEKMVTTFKVACKAVRCLRCKYTHFAASQLCKDERHPLRVMDAVKRFYQCGDCGRRTQCLEVVPVRPCTHCGSSKWQRTGMMKEKSVTTLTQPLSIRGGEQKFVNSVVTDANINLLMPEY